MTATKIITFSQSFNERTFLRDLRNDEDLKALGPISDYLGDCLEAMLKRELAQGPNAIARYKHNYTKIKDALIETHNLAPEFFLDGTAPDHVKYAIAAISLGYSHLSPPPGPGPAKRTDTMPTHPMGGDAIDNALSRLENFSNTVLRVLHAVNAMDNRAEQIINLYTNSGHKKNLSTDPISQNQDDMMVITYSINQRLQTGVELAKQTPESFYGNQHQTVRGIIKALGLAKACHWPDNSLTRQNAALTTVLHHTLNAAQDLQLTNT